MLASLEEVGLAPLAFTAHPYARMVVFGFMLVGALALLYGLQIADPKEQAVSLIAIASAVGVGFSANFVTLFIFWEVLTFSVAALLLLRQTTLAVHMGYRFIVFHLAGSLLLLLGILQHHAATGSFVLETPAAGLIFFALAIGFKTAFLPLHVWVAWAYPAASFPTSVILAGLTTKVGVYALARILDPHPAIVLMGAAMAIFGIISALLQSNMRTLLSYHIISQVGYMVAGVGVAGYYGVDGGLLHAVNHMIYKALLFMGAGAVLLATGTEDLHDLSHEPAEGPAAPSLVLRGLPVAAFGALIGALAISGVPPLNGYVSKYLLKTAMEGAGPAEIMLMFAGVGTAVSFCKFFYLGFIRGGGHIRRNATPSMNAAILLAVAACVVLGVRPQLMMGILPYKSDLGVYNAPGVLAALLVLAAGVAVFYVIRRMLENGIWLPAWFSIEYSLYRPVYGALVACCRIASVIDREPDRACDTLTGDGEMLVSCDKVFVNIIEPGEKAGQAAAASGGVGDTASPAPSAGWRRLALNWNIKDLNFDAILMVLMLGFLLFMLTYRIRI